jgi:hypothetical protein
MRASCSRASAPLRHVFGTTSFSIDPYQLGKGNDEGLESGAWWFYAKLGFRPRDAATLRLAGDEQARVRRSPAIAPGPSRYAGWPSGICASTSNPRGTASTSRALDNAC